VVEALVLPSPAALVQVGGAAGAGVHPGAETGQLLHDRKPTEANIALMEFDRQWTLELCEGMN
jgi:hypothetical protein